MRIRTQRHGSGVANALSDDDRGIGTWEHVLLEPSNPVVKRFVAALNAGEEDDFFAVLTPDATMSDDGTERDLRDWTGREIFSSNGHMEVESESDDGLSLTARYSNSTWGEMRTRWRFEISGEQISRFETGQA